MAKTIPQLTDATTVNAADELIIQQGGITKRATGAELAKGLNTINGTVNVKDFGAVGDGVSDNLAAFNSALVFAQTNARAVFVPSGVYYLSGPLVFPNVQGITLFGPSKSSAGALNDVAVRLIFDHVGSPAVQLTRDNQSLSNLLIGGFGARTSTNADNIGVLVEGEDSPTGAARSCHLYGVSVRDQGGSAFVTSGNTYHTRFDSCSCRRNRGHAWVLSEGAFTGRTNTERVGQVVLRDCRSFDNAGHHILCYDEGFGAYRLLVENFESSFYGTYHDATLFVKPAGAVINGENVILTACAFAGIVGSTRTYASLWVSGRVVRSVATRHIGPSSPAVIVGMDSIKDPADILIDGLFVDQGWTSADPFVHIETGVRGVTIVSRNPDRVSNPVSGDTTGAVIHTSNVSFSRLVTDTNRLQILNSTGDTPIDIAREGFAFGITLTRTGAGATTGRLACIGNALTMSTTTDNDVVIQRNGDAARKIMVKSNTINMLTLPTSAAGLVAGDLWNDGGTVKIIT